MTAKVTAFAPAKINLTLHVTGRRDDGYHLLDSLVVFADIGDEITATIAPRTTLSVSGPMRAGVPEDGSNLMLKAANLLPLGQSAQLTLVKNLPPASGIGGGSSDAAATLRALSKLWEVPLPSESNVLSLGADLPVCMSPVPQRMSGIGEQLAAVPGVPDCPILLVNPGVEVSTPAIFKAMTQRDNPAMPEHLPLFRTSRDLADWLATQRNDLQAPAIKIAPEIETVLTALRATSGVMLSRMSGSGATCFGLYASAQERDAAAKTLSKARPHWWVAAGTITSNPRGVACA